jgi:hypothetical protein
MTQIKDFPAGTPAASDFVPYQTPGGVTKQTTVAELEAQGRVLGHMYGEGLAAIPLTTQNVWYGITAYTSGVLHGITVDVADATADHYIVGVAGDYRIIFSGSYSTSGAGTFEVSIFVNGTQCARGCTSQRVLANGDAGNAVGHSVATLPAAAEVSLRVRCTSNAGRTITFGYVSFSIERVG